VDIAPGRRCAGSLSEVTMRARGTHLQRHRSISWPGLLLAGGLLTPEAWRARGTAEGGRATIAFDAGGRRGGSRMVVNAESGGEGGGRPEPRPQR
jgi:hypothetical protein